MNRNSDQRHLECHNQPAYEQPLARFHSMFPRRCYNNVTMFPMQQFSVGVYPDLLIRCEGRCGKDRRHGDNNNNNMSLLVLIGIGTCDDGITITMPR